MDDSQLIHRPGRGWTPWADGAGEYDIEKVWWAARSLNFAKLNVTCWFDGSEIVGIAHWGYRRAQWTMRKPPADWQPLPEIYRLERERVRQEAVQAALLDIRARNAAARAGGAARAG